MIVKVELEKAEELLAMHEADIIRLLGKEEG